MKPEDSSASATNQKQAQGYISLLCFDFWFLTLSSFVSLQCPCLDYIVHFRSLFCQFDLDY